MPNMSTLARKHAVFRMVVSKCSSKKTDSWIVECVLLVPEMTYLSRPNLPVANRYLGFSTNSRKKFLLIFAATMSFAVATPSGATAATAPILDTTTRSDESRMGTYVVFSDVDGTLVHYPQKVPKGEKGNSILKLPLSSTGMRGIISSKTLSLVQDIRKKETKVVLVSGMRTSTMLARLPFLPRADAYCTEGGGRIFYPVEKNGDGFIVTPQPYDGCTEDDLVPFSLVEDMKWRKRIEKVAGKYSLSLEELVKDPNNVPSINERDGLLWDFARHLTSKGYIVDTAGYSTCFRVNEKHQTTISKKEFAALSNGEQEVWEGLGTSVNLACVDFYPVGSGKKNW